MQLAVRRVLLLSDWLVQRLEQQQVDRGQAAQAIKQRQYRVQMLSLFDQLLTAGSTAAPKAALEERLLQCAVGQPSVQRVHARVADAEGRADSSVVDRCEYAGLVEEWLTGFGAMEELDAERQATGATAAAKGMQQEQLVSAGWWLDGLWVLIM